MAADDVKFVNILLGRGVLNTVVNLQFGVYHFDANRDGKIDPSPTPNLRMRMDVPCARSVYAALGELLAAIDAPQDTRVDGENAAAPLPN